MINEYDFKRLVSKNITKFKLSDIMGIHDDIKEIDEQNIIKILKLIDYIKQQETKVPKWAKRQKKDELLKEIKDTLIAHKTNMKMMGYSQLIGFIFNYYIYTKINESNKKFQDISKELENECNNVNAIQRDSEIKLIKKFFRLQNRLIKKNKSIKDIYISDKRKKCVVEDIERLYKKRVDKDTYKILFVKILFESKILSLIKANEIGKIVFNSKTYISEDKLQDDKVNAIYNRYDNKIGVCIATKISIFTP